MQICTYSVCHNGRITARTSYPSTFTAGQGATSAFQHMDHPGTFNWVKTFVAKNKFTGQIAFDFIQSHDGQIYALECNPRATSGVHLLTSHQNFTEVFLNSNMDCITPTSGHSSMLGTAMLVYGLPRALKKNQLIHWIKTFFTSNDVFWILKIPCRLLCNSEAFSFFYRLQEKKKLLCSKPTLLISSGTGKRDRSLSKKAFRKERFFCGGEGGIRTRDWFYPALT